MQRERLDGEVLELEVLAAGKQIAELAVVVGKCVVWDFLCRDEDAIDGKGG